MLSIQVNTDNNIDAVDVARLGIEATVRQALDIFASRITRIEVHLRDDSAGRTTNGDKRCMIEARPARSAAVAVTCQAATIEQAVNGALDKIHALLTSRFGRLTDQSRSADTVRGARPRA
jgi:hypothetical protein